MMMLRVGEALPRLMPSYRSIDFRCATGFHVNEWINLHTVIRFTHQRVSEVEAIYDSRAKMVPIIETPRFRIVCRALPISRWNTIKEQISSGCINLDGLRFKISAFDLDSLPCLVAKNPLNVVSEGWNILEASSQSYSTIPFERYEFELVKLGYPTTYNALNTWLQTKLTAPLAPEIVIAAPIYAKILLSERRTEKTLRIVIEKRRALENLHVTVEVSRETFEQTGVQETLQLHTIPLESDREESTFDLRLPAALKADQVRVSLVSVQPKPIVLDWSEVGAQKQSRHPPTFRNSLLAVFNRLRDIGHIQDYLHIEGVVNVDAFYNAVVWVLSLCGFSVIYLGDTAKRRRRGYIRQVEVIGSDQLSNSVVLGVGAASEGQIMKCVEVLEKVRDSMSDELGEETQVIPLLFYRRIAPQSSKIISASRGVIILDNLELNRIVELLKNDNIREARRRFGVHTPSTGLP